MIRKKPIHKALIEMLRDKGVLSPKEMSFHIHDYYDVTESQKKVYPQWKQQLIYTEIRRNLTDLVRTGKVKRIGHGRYKLASEKSEPFIRMTKEPTKSIRSTGSQKSGDFEDDVKQFVDKLLGKQQKYESQKHKHLDISIHPKNGGIDTFKVAIECKGYRYKKPDASNPTYDNHMKRASNDIAVQQQLYPHAKYFLVVFKESDSDKTNERWRKQFQEAGVSTIVWTNEESKDKLAREIKDLK